MRMKMMMCCRKPSCEEKVKKKDESADQSAVVV